MRKIVSSVILLTLLLLPIQSRADIPVRARAFGTVVAYGATSGAILGAASMAFGQSTRAIFQGASLGLYAGILFGTYVIVSHRNRQAGSYDDNRSPYKESSDIYGEDYQSDEGGASGENKREGFFRTEEGKLPPLYLNFFNYSF
jgi:hypothetical protein